MPKVLNKYHSNTSIDAVYIGRHSKWGNPFKIGQVYKNLRLTRDQVIDCHTDWLLYSDIGKELLKDIGELRGKNLLCFCKPLSCHGDLLLELANQVD